MTRKSCDRKLGSHHFEPGIQLRQNNASPHEKVSRRRRSSDADMSTNSCSRSVDSNNKLSVSLEDSVAVVDSDLLGAASVGVDVTGVHDGKVSTSEGLDTSSAQAFDREASNSYLEEYSKLHDRTNDDRDYNKTHVVQPSDDVSDISHSESESSLVEEDWVMNGSSSELKRPRFSSQRNHQKNHTICSIISNTSDHGSIQSLRENVDRLLMSSANSMGGGLGRGGMAVQSRSSARQCMQKNVSPTVARMLYDENYYKSSDWLRFVPRRNSSFAENESFSSSQDRLSSTLGSHSSPGFHHSHHVPLTPDRYYRGFDNTRIRVGFHPGNVRRTVVRRQERDHDMHGGEATSHHGIMTAPPACGFHVDTFRTRHPNLVIDTPIDEEVAIGEREGHVVLSSNAKTVSSSDVSNMSLLPKEIQCADTEDSCQVVLEEENEIAEENVHCLQQSREVVHEVMGGEMKLPPFQSSLRKGAMVRPTGSHASGQNRIDLHSVNIPDHIREEQMHQASWDSKYETYACRVDQTQDDRAVEIPLFSMGRPHMRAFHFAWIAFFLVFLAWFSIAPLLSEVQESLGLTKQQIWTSSICSVAGGLVTRCIMGVLCDIYGARLMSALVLFACGIPTCFTGLVNTSVGLSVLRLAVGIGGSAFVTCQYWTSTMFTREVAGTANALAAGWGNLGGGVTYILTGSIMFPLLEWIYRTAGTTMDPAELAWRTSCILPGLLCIGFTFVVIRSSDDSPKGNYQKRKRLGLMQKDSALYHLKSAVTDLNTWLLLIQYGCCFGVELTTSNAVALYFKEEFELSTASAAAVGSVFGWMNLFCRGLGGFLSDVSNAYRGMRGRLFWQHVTFFLEGVFIIVFSRARTLAGAITALMTFSLFVQAAEGSTFGIVPYLNPNLTGTVSGVIGAGGNAGAVVFSIIFRQTDYRSAFFYMGVATACTSLLSNFVWIKGYQGLFLKRRLVPQPPPNVEQAGSTQVNIES
ncbi:hypothetical protein ACHAW6_013254 [Cyclotella cf. meneghiniana]